MRAWSILALVAVLLAWSSVGCTKIKRRPEDPQLDRLVSQALPQAPTTGEREPACDEAGEAWSSALLVLEERSGTNTLRVGVRMERAAASDGTERLSMLAARLHTEPEAVPWQGRIEEELEGWSIRVRRPSEPADQWRFRLEVPTAPEVDLFARRLVGALAGAELAWAWCRRVPAGETALWKAQVVAGVSPEPIALSLSEGAGVLQVLGPASMDLILRGGRLGGATAGDTGEGPRYNMLLVPSPASKQPEGASGGRLGYPGKGKKQQSGLESRA